MIFGRTIAIAAALVAIGIGLSFVLPQAYALSGWSLLAIYLLSVCTTALFRSQPEDGRGSVSDFLPNNRSCRWLILSGLVLSLLGAAWAVIFDKIFIIDQVPTSSVPQWIAYPTIILFLIGNILFWVGGASFLYRKCEHWKNHR